MIKKIITFFVVFSFVLVGFMYNSMMAFAMQSDMHSQIMGEKESECCEDESVEPCNVECYYSSNTSIGLNSINLSNSQKLKIKIIDYNFLALLNEKLEINYLDKVSSPPRVKLSIQNTGTYTDLIGIIKNNC